MPRDLEQALVRRAQAGDRASFERLVKAYYARVIKLLMRYLRNPDDAADVAQDVFLRLYLSLPGFRGESSLFTYLFSIAVNAAKSHLAAAKRDPAAGALAVDDAAEAGWREMTDWETPERLALGGELHEAVLRAIDALPREVRAALVLREFELLSYREIADRIHCPLGTVRSRIFRGRAAIAALQSRP